MDLFTHQAERDLSLQPLAERMRPLTLDELVGQQHILGPGTLLRRAIEQDRVPSMILWGPPGVGKTTIARVIAQVTKAEFVSLSAVLSGVKEIREVVGRAEQARAMHRRRTLLFVDEIHRFNKSQQDALLPHVERGVVTLVGATTENPSFEVNAALLSRARVFPLRAISPEDLLVLLKRALVHPRGLGIEGMEASPEALNFISLAVDGDARKALLALEVAADSALSRYRETSRKPPTPPGSATPPTSTRPHPTPPTSASARPATIPGIPQDELRDELRDKAKNELWGRVKTEHQGESQAQLRREELAELQDDLEEANRKRLRKESEDKALPLSEDDREGEEVVLAHPRVELADAEAALQQRSLPYDKQGEHHYNLASAFIKSMRGSDPDAAVYYMVRMLEGGEPARFISRRMVIFAAEDVGNADPGALRVALDAFQAAEFVGLPEAVLPLTMAATYLAMAPKSNSALVAYAAARRDVLDQGGLEVPLKLRNAPTGLMKGMGYGGGYRYPHDFTGNYVPEEYLPEPLLGRRYYRPSDSGAEALIKERMDHLLQEREQKRKQQIKEQQAQEQRSQAQHEKGAPSPAQPQDGPAKAPNDR